MNKIQLEPGPASSATHRLTQPSSTLNRRYVTHPTNLAIEEAAQSISERNDTTPSKPSRLVNLRVHSSDLLAAEAQSASNRPAEPMIHHVVEFGGAPEEITQPAPAPQPEPIISLPAAQPVAVVETVTETVTTYAEPTNMPSTIIPLTTEASVSALTPTTLSAPTPVSIDPRDLAVSIAADYAAASMSAVSSEAEPVAPVSVDTYVGIDTTSTDSLDTIAQAASDAIASIRNATEPEEISEQIASLQSFAESIRANSSLPEMTELSDTIEKFISVAKKSTKVQEAAKKKVTLSPKVNRAANKVTKSSAKVINRARPVVKASAKPTPAPRQASKTTVRPAPRVQAKPLTNATKKAAPRPAVKPATSPDQDQALRRALRSVAAMDNEPEARPAKSTVRRKGTARRFAVAFVCAILCVGAITYFVSTNIPDISVRVAAMQTGVEASYPSYIPRDYTLKDISSESGKITMTFDGPDGASFVLSEEKSSWDSTTLLRNYVEPTWKDNYTSTHEQGITIYISGSNAAWVNGGVLYKINSSTASLTNKQLRNIVTSM